MRSKEEDKTKGLALLKKGLINGPYTIVSDITPTATQTSACRTAWHSQADNSNNESVENEESTAESIGDDDYVHVLGKSVQWKMNTRV